MSNLEILHGYRHLYRAMLRAVQFSNRSRYVARDHLRRSFRNEMDTLDPEAIKRTRWFLEAAAKERGLEHRILKNLVRKLPQPHERMVSSWRQQQNLSQRGDRVKQADDAADELKKKAPSHYHMTIAMLNKSMGMCLR